MGWRVRDYLSMIYVVCVALAAVYAYSDDSGLTSVPLWGLTLPSSVVLLTGVIPKSAARSTLLILGIAQSAALLWLVLYRDMQQVPPDDADES